MGGGGGDMEASFCSRCCFSVSLRRKVREREAGDGFHRFNFGFRRKFKAKVP